MGGGGRRGDLVGILSMVTVFLRKTDEYGREHGEHVGLDEAHEHIDKSMNTENISDTTRVPPAARSAEERRG